MAAKAKTGGMGSTGAKKENLDDLKQELDIDYHKITSDELYQRFQTHPENVSSVSICRRQRMLHTNHNSCHISTEIGSESCKGQGKFGARWTECANTTETNTRMG